MSIIQQLNNVIRKQIGRYITGVSHSMNQNFTYLPMCNGNDNKLKSTYIYAVIPNSGYTMYTIYFTCRDKLELFKPIPLF